MEKIKIEDVKEAWSYPEEILRPVEIKNYIFENKPHLLTYYKNRKSADGVIQRILQDNQSTFINYSYRGYMLVDEQFTTKQKTEKLEGIQNKQNFLYKIKVFIAKIYVNKSIF